MSLFDQFNYEEDYSAQSGGYGGSYSGGGGGIGGGMGGFGGGGFGGFEDASGVGSEGFQEDEPYAGSGVVSARLQDEEPLFQKSRLDLQLPPSTTITHVVCASNVLVVALASNVLVLRQAVPRPSSSGMMATDPDAATDTIDLGRKPGDSVQNLFADDTGTHILVCICTRDGQHESVYVNTETRKAPLLLRKLKGVHVTAVGWHRGQSAAAAGGGAASRTTHEILIGSSQGTVYEAEIDKTDKFFKQIFQVDAPRTEPVTGLRYECLSPEGARARTFFVMVTTPRRSYQFIGVSEAQDAPVLAGILANQQGMRLHELAGELNHSRLEVFCRHPDPAETFAWLTAPGVYCGRLDFRAARQRAGDAQAVQNILTDGRLLPWQHKESRSGAGDKAVPATSLVVTEFHVILLYPDHYEVVCLLNDKQVMKERFVINRVGAMIGLVKDPVMESVFVYSSRYIYRIQAVNETRDVWKLHLEQGHFEEALKYCKGNSAHEDKVLTAQAEAAFKAKDYQTAAEVFAKTAKSFEDIALMFIDTQDTDALILFLRRKLDTLDARDKTQLTLICTWLVEIYLNALNTLKEQGDVAAHGDRQADFRAFLEDDRVRSNLDNATVYDLIASHGNVDDLTFFATLIGDYERVILHHTQIGAYTEALDVLKKQGRLELYYRLAPLLMQHIPREMVNACMERVSLDPRQLIPAFIRYQQAMGGAAVAAGAAGTTGTTGTDGGDRDGDGDGGGSRHVQRYLEWCIRSRGNKDPAIHNYLLSLYAKLKDDGLLLAFLDSQGDEPLYDQKYALRLCMQQNRLRACVAIYSTMGLYEEAVDLALKVDLKLARQNADMPAYDQELRKKLWLRIARHVVEDERNVKKAMAVLQECELLKIEDILPFFPDFVTIDHFQADICKSLEAYNRDIENLKEEMDNATQSARAIRSDIQALRNKCGVVQGNSTCGICGYPLLTRPFYLFPCNHGFHSDCMLTEVMKTLKPAQQRRVTRMQGMLRQQIASSSDGPNAPNVLSLKTDLDNIIAEDCLICGEGIIRAIDEPFCPKADLPDFIRSWSLGGPTTL